MKKMLIFMVFSMMLIGGVSISEAKGSRSSISTSVSKPSTPKVSTPKVNTSKSSISSSSTSKSSTSTTSKSKTVILKKSPSTTKSTTDASKSSNRKSVKIMVLSGNNGLYRYNGSYSPFLVINDGSYLILTGFEKDGDPIYVNPCTKKEVDDDDLDELGAKAVKSIPGSCDKERENDNSGTMYSIIAITAFIAGLLAGVLLTIVVRK